MIGLGTGQNKEAYDLVCIPVYCVYTELATTGVRYHTVYGKWHDEKLLCQSMG